MMYTGVTANCNMAGLGLMVAESAEVDMGGDWDNAVTADPCIDTGRKLSLATLPPVALLEYTGDRCTMGWVAVARGRFWAEIDFITASSCSRFLTLVTTA